MPRKQTLIASLRRILAFTRHSKLNRSKFPLIVAGIAILAAVATSISVESRSSGLFWNTDRDTQHLSSVSANQGDMGLAKNSMRAWLNPTRSLAPYRISFASPVDATVTASKTDSLFTDVDGDTKADPGDTLKYTIVIGA